MIRRNKIKYCICIYISLLITSLVLGVMAYIYIGIVEKEITMDTEKYIQTPYNFDFIELCGTTKKIIIIEIILTLIFIVIIIYITKYRNMVQDKLERMAFYDDITAGITVEKFKIESSIILKNNIKKYGLIQFDIDNFKLINDRVGYKKGDNLLYSISEILKLELIETELFCRLKDDVFLLLLEYNSVEEIIGRLENLDRNIHKNIYIDNLCIGLVLAYGVYLIEDKDEEFKVIIDKASMARKSVKGNYNEFIGIYRSELKDNLLEIKEIESVMYSALANGEFLLYIQGKYDAKTKELNCGEALVRWDNKNKGIIYPDKFISIFEKNGFIVNLDIYMLSEVCKTIRSWIDRGIKVVPISVNISRVHLNNIDFLIDNMKKIMTIYEIGSEVIELEMTESIMFDDSIDVVGSLLKIKSMGVKLSLDDFGSGYSSLNMLKELPIDIIKLDKLFLDKSELSEKGKIVIKNIVRMAKELNLTVVAEGIETKEQSEFLEEIGCDLLQGYLYRKPISVEEFEKYDLIKLEWNISELLYN